MAFFLRFLVIPNLLPQLANFFTRIYQSYPCPIGSSIDAERKPPPLCSLCFSHFFLRPVRSLVSQLKTSNQVMLNIWWISNDCFTLLNLPTDSQRKQLDARSNGKRRRPPSIVGPRKPFFGSGASTSDLCALGRWLSKDVPAKNKKIAGIRENFFFI